MIDAIREQLVVRLSVIPSPEWLEETVNAIHTAVILNDDKPLALGKCVCVRQPTEADREVGIQDGYGVLVVAVPPTNGEVKIGRVFLQDVYLLPYLSPHDNRMEIE